MSQRNSALNTVPEWKLRRFENRIREGYARKRQSEIITKEKVEGLASRFDSYLISLSARLGVPFLRYSIGIVFIWFGGLKFFGHLSPAYDLVAATVYWLRPEIIVPLLGAWEVAIGVCFLIPPLTRLGILLLALQMPGTFLPLVLLPEVCFTLFPFGLTLEGQYIVKNLVIIGAALVIGAGLTHMKEKRSNDLSNWSG